MAGSNVTAVCRHCGVPVPVFGFYCPDCCGHGLGPEVSECADCTEYPGAVLTCPNCDTEYPAHVARRNANQCQPCRAELVTYA